MSAAAVPLDQVRVSYGVPRASPSWVLEDETMPESLAHDVTVSLLRDVLGHRAAQLVARGESVLVVRNLAVRWDEQHPRVGVDPDVAWLSPAPPAPEALRSLRTWLVGHAPPRLAIEVVSDTNPHKDYSVAPDKYAAAGVQELCVFDPLLAGPTTHGGPHLLQLWQRGTEGASAFTRGYAGAGPVRSEVLGAWFVVTEGGARLRVADDPLGESLWLTEAEAQRDAKEAALRRVAELEAELARGK